MEEETIKPSIQKKGNIHYYFEAKSRFKRVNLICVNARKERVDNQRSFGDVASNLESKLTELENKGFPFAQVKIIDQVEEGNSMTIKYLLDSGNYFFIDKIHIKSESKIHEKTFLTMINLKVGDTYDEAKIRGIEEQLDWQLLKASQQAFEKQVPIFARRGLADCTPARKRRRANFRRRWFHRARPTNRRMRQRR